MPGSAGEGQGVVLAVHIPVWRKERPPRAAGTPEDFMHGREGHEGWVGAGSGKSRGEGTQAGIQRQ